MVKRGGVMEREERRYSKEEKEGPGENGGRKKKRLKEGRRK